MQNILETSADFENSGNTMGNSKNILETSIGLENLVCDWGNLQTAFIKKSFYGSTTCLHDVRSFVHQLLVKFGFTFVQNGQLDTEKGEISVITLILHHSGEFIATKNVFPTFLLETTCEFQNTTESYARALVSTFGIIKETTKRDEKEQTSDVPQYTGTNEQMVHLRKLLGTEGIQSEDIFWKVHTQLKNEFHAFTNENVLQSIERQTETSH